MHHPRTSAALAVCGLLILTGCSDDTAEADPEPILPSSSSAEPSPDEPTDTASPTAAPTLPAAAEERSYDGAAEFVRHWVDLFNLAQATGDAQPMLEISDPRCVSCGDTERAVNNIYGNGGMILSNGWIVRQVGSDQVTPLEAPTLSASIRQTAEKVRLSRSDDVEVVPGNTFTVLFDLERDGDRWVMREVDVQ